MIGHHMTTAQDSPDSSFSESSDETDHHIPTTMRAVGRADYGEPEDLGLMEVDVPSVEANQVLVRMHASSVNPLDWHFCTGTPMFMRLMAGVRRPKQPIRGADFAGEVVAVGSAVARFSVGDRVFGEGASAWADYMAINEKGIAAIPEGVSSVDAAASPVAALTALQAIRDWGEFKPGQSVLVNGASGGVGVYAVQIAKALGASEVVGVCSGRNSEMVLGLGADRVIDYTSEDFTKTAGSYDVFIDNIGHASLGTSLGVVNNEGAYVMVSGKKGKFVRPVPRMIGAMIRNVFTKKRLAGGTARADANDLEQIAGWIADGTIKTVVDRTFALEDAPEGLAYLATSRTRGKNIITVEPMV